MARPSTASWLSSNHFQPGRCWRARAARRPRRRRRPSGRRPSGRLADPERKAACWCSVSALKPSRELQESGPAAVLLPAQLGVGASWWRVTRSSPRIAAPPRRSSNAISRRWPRASISPIRPLQRSWTCPRTGRKASARADGGTSFTAQEAQLGRRVHVEIEPQEPARRIEALHLARRGHLDRRRDRRPLHELEPLGLPFGFSTRAPSAAGYGRRPASDEIGAPGGREDEEEQGGKEAWRAMGAV